MVAPDPDAPTAFIAYTHDSPQHKADVLALATLLVNNGVQTELDQWAEGRRQDWHTWALRHISASDYTIIIASPQCKVVGDGGMAAAENRGAQAEMRAIRDLLQDDYEKWLPKLLPVVLPGRDVAEIPLFLQPRAADHYVVELTDDGIENLLRGIYEEPRIRRPALGQRPDFSRRDSAAVAGSPRTTELSWRALPAEVDVLWRPDVDSLARFLQQQWPAALELHLVPVDDVRIPSSQMRSLESRLPFHASEHGVLDVTSGVDRGASPEVVMAGSRAPFGAGGGGMAVSRNGQRSAWMTLPQSSPGSVLTRDDAVRKIQTMLTALLGLELELPAKLVPVAGIDPVRLVRLGVEAMSPTMPVYFRSHLRLEADEFLTSGELSAMPDQVATELADRLIAQFPEPRR